VIYGIAGITKDMGRKSLLHFELSCERDFLRDNCHRFLGLPRFRMLERSTGQPLQWGLI
jgi:hypothetical protein